MLYPPEEVHAEWLLIWAWWSVVERTLRVQSEEDLDNVILTLEGEIDEVSQVFNLTKGINKYVSGNDP